MPARKKKKTNGIRCRDSKLFDETLSRESLECYYRLGGLKYLSAAQESAQTNQEPAPILRDVLIGMGAVSVALMALASDEERQDEDFFQKIYYAMLATEDILEVIRMLRERRDYGQRPLEQTYDYSAEKKKEFNDDEESDEDYDEEYARNHGYDDYDEDEQGWGMGIGM